MKSENLRCHLFCAALVVASCLGCKRQDARSEEAQPSTTKPEGKNLEVSRPASDAKSSKTPAVDKAESVTKRLLKAFTEDDFKIIYELDADSQKEVASIKEQEPQFTWEKKLQEHYDKKKTAFYGRIVRPDSNLAILLAFKPATEIIEVKRITPQNAFLGEPRENAYIRLTYASPEQSPLESSGTKLAKSLKETVVEFSLNQAGLLANVQRLKDQDVFWTNLPLQVVAVSFRREKDSAWFDCRVLSTAQVSKASVSIGGIPFELVNRWRGSGGEWAWMMDLWATPFIGNETNIECSVLVETSSGRAESMRFTVPALDSNPRLFVSSPWHEDKYWKRRAIQNLGWEGDVLPLVPGDTVQPHFVELRPLAASSTSDLPSSTPGEATTSLVFVNDTEKEVRCHSVDQRGRRTGAYWPLAPKGTQIVPTYVGAAFLITDSTNNPLEFFVAGEKGARAVIKRLAP